MRADARPVRSGYYTLREHSARASSRERFREERKKQGRREKGKERRRHYSTQFLAPTSRTALVSRFYVNGPLLKRPGNQIRINGPSSVSLDADFMRDGRSRSCAKWRSFMRLRKKKIVIRIAQNRVTKFLQRSIITRMRELYVRVFVHVQDFYFRGVAINLS